MSTSSAPPTVLAPEDLTLLRRLSLAHRRPAQGLLPGHRRSTRTARSPELADFRPYAPGDDIRQIDWRAYGRLERLVVRLYVAEQESALNVVLDASESMALGNPAKWPAARRLAAAVAMLGLAAGDRVAVGALDRTGPRATHVRPGGGGAARLLGFLGGLEPGGGAGADDLAELAWLRPGVTVVVSDFMFEADWGPPLAGLRRRSQEPLLWQVLGPDEESPKLAGDVTLVEAESGRQREMTITPRVLKEYLKNLAALRDGLRQSATSAGGLFLHTRSDDSLEAALAAAIRAGAVRRF
ncbi:MAG: DUF58 domain-containing protein [Acidimicrobiales bacterium]